MIMMIIKLCWLNIFRWDLSYTENLPDYMKLLPDYMKLCYEIYYDIVHEVAWEAEKEQGRELVSFFRKGVSKIELFR